MHWQKNIRVNQRCVLSVLVWSLVYFVFIPNVETMELKKPIVNVKDFGAKGDGVTDDTANIQKTIDSLKTTGGTVFFPEGTYLVSQAGTNKSWCLELRSNIFYVGLGYESKIVLKAGQNKFVRLMSTGLNENVKNIIISGLHLDGNKAKQNKAYEQQHAILLAGVEDCEVRHCIIHDFIGDGIYVHHGSSPIGSQRVLVEENEIFESKDPPYGRVGVNFMGASNSIARCNFIHDKPNNSMKMEQNPANKPLVFSNNRFARNTIVNAGGISLSSSKNAKVCDIFIDENRFESVKGPAIGMGDVRHVEVIGNTITNNAGSAILIRSSIDVIVQNNTIALAFARQGWDAAIKTFSHTSSGILPPSTNIRIEGNKLLFNKMSGIRIRRCEFSSIANNVVSGSKVGLGIKKEKIIPSGIEVMVNSKNNHIEGNIVEYNQGYGIRIIDGAAINRFRDNLIRANSLGGIWVLSNAGLDNDFGLLNDPGNNCIYANKNFGIKNETAVIEARGNYWGCSSGPGKPGCDTVGNNVIVYPVLKNCPN